MFSPHWFIKGLNMGPFLKKEVEDLPFIKAIYIPNCDLVGPYHRLENDDRFIFRPVDDYEYEDREITDEEFRSLHLEFLGSRRPNGRIGKEE
jgi:hypothetical protein